MKKLIRITMFLAVAAMTFASCEKDNDDDPRDQFVGSYTSVSSGTMSMTIGGQKIPDVPLAGTDIFTISKAGDANKVIVKSNGESTECNVSGNKLTYSEPFAESEDGMVLSGTMNVEGVLSGKTLTFTQKATGTISGEMSGTFTLNVTEIATKK